ncbi:MAG: DinB family protein, partial [Achromobacter kerstersii]|uniref:DinB family protein n=1 Tax=Achromobacter kerstersii TaxID=1353890 RepID=UPI003D037221
MEPACLLTHPATGPYASGQAGQHDRYDAVRSTSTALAAPLSPEDCQVQSMPDCSPVKWHLAHTTWFFETFLLTHFHPPYTMFHPQYRMLFNSYYNAIGAKHPRPHRGLLSRPALSDVLQYRQHVDGAMHDLISRLGGNEPAFDALLELGLNHEQQHQELILTDVKHMLSANPLKPAYVAGGSP